MPATQDCQSQVKCLEDLLNVEEASWPKKTVIFLDGHPHQPAFTMSFDSTVHLVSSLNNPVVNPEDPFSPCNPPDKRVDGMLTGSWHRHAADTMVEDPQRHSFCCPLVLTTDKRIISDRAELPTLDYSPLLETRPATRWTIQFYFDSG